MPTPITNNRIEFIIQIENPLTFTADDVSCLRGALVMMMRRVLVLVFVGGSGGFMVWVNGFSGGGCGGGGGGFVGGVWVLGVFEDRGGFGVHCPHLFGA